MSNQVTNVIFLKGSDAGEVTKFQKLFNEQINQYEVANLTWRIDLWNAIQAYQLETGENSETSTIQLPSYIEVEYCEVRDNYFTCAMTMENYHLLDMIHYLIGKHKLTLDLLILFDDDYADYINCDIATYVGGSILSNTYMYFDYSVFYGEPAKFDIMIKYGNDLLDFLKDAPLEIKSLFNENYLFLDV